MVAAKTLNAVRDHWEDPLYRASYILMANQIVTYGSGFLFWLVAARSLPPNIIGLATAAVGGVVLVNIAAKLGFDVSLLREVPQSQRAEELLRTSFTLSLVAALIGALAFAVGASLWAPALAPVFATPVFVLFFVALAGAWTSSSLLDAFFIASRKANLAFWKNLVHSLLKVSLLPLAILFVSDLGPVGLLVLFYGTLVPPLVLAGFVWLPRTTGGHRLGLGIDRRALKSLFGSSLANYGVSLAQVMPLSLGSLIILIRFGAAESAIFYVLWQFGGLAMVAATAFSQASLVEIMHAGKVRQALRLRPALITTAFALLVVASGWFLLPAFGPIYAARGVVSLVPFGLAAIPGYVLYTRMAQLRATAQNFALVSVAVIVVGTFLAGLSLLPLGAGTAGWLWVGAHVLAAAVAMGVPLRVPPRGFVTTAPSSLEQVP